ncbi:IS30 family transposase [Pseudoclavibacter chungangensis]|nr:IS30 family transposase [Pseudoclavibacter chungangensis]
MIERYEAGATLREVADEFGVHRMTVSRALKRADVRLRRAGLDETSAQRATELYGLIAIEGVAAV